MATTRTNLTVAFVAGLIAITTALGLTVWTVRNATVYDDIGRYAVTQAELAASVIRETREGVQTVVGRDTAAEALVVTPQLRAMLGAFPDYLVITDTRGIVIYQSVAIERLGGGDSAVLAGQLANLRPGGPAGLLSLPIANERILLVANALTSPTARLGRILVGVPTRARTALPREYMVVFFVIAPFLVLASGWVAYAAFGQTAQRIAKIAHDVAALTDGRSLHRRLTMDDSGREFAGLLFTLNAMIERLENSFMGLRRFTADASHELKTPLTVMRADVERAMNEPSKRERMVALEEALHETTRMADLVESLLTLARADEGRFDIHREPVDLEQLVKDVYETAQILGEAANVAVNLPFTAPATVMGDSTRLRQLFLNLVTNAIKYTPAGGKVDIGLGAHPDNITFAVRDTGIGIAAADVPYIFERFWRADRVRSRMSERGGFGLGLAISQWIAQAHGGTLTASSRLGRGSLFTVTLPLPPSGKT